MAEIGFRIDLAMVRCLPGNMGKYRRRPRNRLLMRSNTPPSTSAPVTLNFDLQWGTQKVEKWLAGFGMCFSGHEKWLVCVGIQMYVYIYIIELYIYFKER